MVCDMIGLRFLKPYDWLRAFETFSKPMDFFKNHVKNQWFSLDPFIFLENLIYGSKPVF
jgi:hypothetical protein